MSVAEAKINLDVTGLETGTQRAEAAAKRLVESDQRVKQQLEKSLKPAAGDHAARFNSKMIGDIINMGTASSGAVMRVNALTHALKISPVLAGGVVAVASAIGAVSEAAKEAYVNSNKMEESLMRVYRGGLGANQSEASILSKQDQGRKLKEGLEEDQVKDSTWFYALWNNSINSKMLGGVGADEARAQRNQEIQSIRSGEFESSQSIATKREKATGIQSLRLSDVHAANRAKLVNESKEGIEEDLSKFTGQDPEARKRIIQERQKQLQTDLQEDQRKEAIENMLLSAETAKASLRSSSDTEHAQQLQIELETASKVLGMTKEKQDVEKASAQLAKATQAIVENDLRVDLQRLNIGKTDKQSETRKFYSVATEGEFGDTKARSDAAMQVQLAADELEFVNKRVEREKEAGAISKEALSEQLVAENSLKAAKIEQLRTENEITFANKQALSSMQAQGQATYLNITGRARQASLLTQRQETANQAEQLRRNGRPEQAGQVEQNERLSEEEQMFDLLGGGKNVSRSRRMLARQERLAKRRERRFKTFEKMGGGMRNVRRGMDGRIISGKNALTGETEGDGEHSALEFFHGGQYSGALGGASEHSALGAGSTVSALEFNQPKSKGGSIEDRNTAEITKRLDQIVNIWKGN